jgi:hypothetical protein
MVGEHGLLAACGIKLATAGYGVFGIDYEGHGKSMGARCYIQKFENLVADCDRFFKSICGKNIFLAFSSFFIENCLRNLTEVCNIFTATTFVRTGQKCYHKYIY